MALIFFGLFSHSYTQTIFPCIFPMFLLLSLVNFSLQRHRVRGLFICNDMWFFFTWCINTDWYMTPLRHISPIYFLFWDLDMTERIFGTFQKLFLVSSDSLLREYISPWENQKESRKKYPFLSFTHLFSSVLSFPPLSLTDLYIGFDSFSHEYVKLEMVLCKSSRKNRFKHL